MTDVSSKFNLSKMSMNHFTEVTEEEIGPQTQCYFWNLNLGTLLHCVHNALLSIASEKISLRRGNTVHGNELAIK